MRPKALSPYGFFVRPAVARHAGDGLYFGFGSPRRAASTLPALPWAAGGIRSDNRDKPPLNRRHRDNKSISISLEFFAIVRLARAAPSRCSLGRMHNGKIFLTAPKRESVTDSAIEACYRCRPFEMHVGAPVKQHIQYATSSDGVRIAYAAMGQGTHARCPSPRELELWSGSPRRRK
jgi:hypothetical protein